MRKRLFDRIFLIGAGVLTGLLLASCGGGVTRYVNPFVGTDGHGHTYPGAIVPFGQIQPSPDTRLDGWDGCSGYHYSDDTLYGFSHTHLSGTGCEDYCDILLMPVQAMSGAGESPEIIEGWSFTEEMPQEEFKSHFSHRGEKAEPGYYRVVLDRNRVMVELTASERVAAHRYTFPSRGKKGFVIDLRHRDRVINAGLRAFDAAGTQFYKKGHPIVGARESSAWNPDQKCYFALECDQEIQEVHLFDGGRKALVTLPDNCTKAEVYVAISGVDMDGAAKNLATRGGQNFDQMRHAAHRQWEQTLGKITVEGGSHKVRRNFYTALYHCYTSPYLWSDADGRYRGMDDSIYTSKVPMYTVFSLWDTYRALHPLMTLLEPDRTRDWIATMLRQYETGGELTMWELAGHETHCMIGYHTCPVILEARQAGLLDNWPAERRIALLEAMVATSNRTEAHRAYARQGYLDSQTDNESVSKTLEYAFDDWCIGRFAELERLEHLDQLVKLEQLERLEQLEKEYYRRSQSWQNLMDTSGFMHARRNGGFITPFDPTEVNNLYTEANCWQYSSYVPHDVEGWIALLGGKEKAEAFLDSLFTTSSATTGRDQSDITGMIGQYAHGNEPSHHAAYLYAYVDAPKKVDKTVHRIMKELYSPTPDGLCGNEDCGQMSAWYVLSAMGFYPVCPGSGEYVTCTPLFDRVTLHPEGKEPLVIDKKNWQPGKFWGTKEASDTRATSSTRTTSNTRLPVAPWFSDWQERFEDSARVEIMSRATRETSATSSTRETGATRIYYTLNGMEPDTLAMRYTGPFTVRNDITVRAVAYDPQTGCYSPVVNHRLTRYIPDKQLTYLTEPDPQYRENGEEGLTDRLYGTENYRIGGWQGWTGDMEVVVDLHETRLLTSVGVDCLEQMRSWIFFPRRVEVSVSTDGKRYIPWGLVENDQYEAIRSRQEESVKHTFTCTGPQCQTRFVRIKAVNYGPLPDWHASAGEQAWLFVDEVEVSHRSLMLLSGVEEE